MFLFVTPAQCHCLPRSAHHNDNGGKFHVPFVDIYSSSLDFTAYGLWSLMTLASGTYTSYDFGMHGFSSSSDLLIADGEPRIRQAFQEMAGVVSHAGGDLTSCLTLVVVYVSDMCRLPTVVDNVKRESWGEPASHYPKTIRDTQRSNGDDVCEVGGTFRIGPQRA